MTKPTYTAFTVRERGDNKPFWLGIGSAWINADGSLNVSLDAIPLDGKLCLRVRKDKDAEPSQD